MGPLSRAVAAAVLAALLGGHAHAQGVVGQDVAIDAGTCSGTARTSPPPVLDGPPFDLSRTPVPKEWRATWTNAGYRFDDAGGRILRADGKPLPDGEYRRLVTPFDAAAERVEAIRWIGLMSRGVRLDERTCFFIAPGTNLPVTRLEMAATAPNSEKSLEFTGLSNLRATLLGLPGDKAIPAAVAARLRAAQAAGARLPQKVLDALAAGAPAREILADTDAAYAALTRYFDAQRDNESLVSSARPYVPGIDEQAKRRVLVGPVEERLAAALSKDLMARFSTHEAGREILERFRDKDGVVRLPVVHVLKLSQRPDDPGYGMAAAIQDSSNGSVIVNHWVAARIAVAAAPPERRAALAREFADAAKLNARLLKDPALRRKVLKGVEIMVAHEFVHAWQHRRSRYDVEVMRGNIPGSILLENEQEAYREQYRYFHSLLKAHPADAVALPEMFGYRSAISDYEGYRAQITHTYMGTFAGSSDYRTVAQVQEDRRAMALRLRGESLKQWGRQGLKLLGYERGDKALLEARAVDDRRANDFLNKELPRMQAESGGLILRAYESAGRPDLALAYDVEHWIAKRPDAERYVRGTLARLSAPTDPLDDRVRAIMSVQDYARIAKEAPPKALAAAIRRDYPLMVEEWLAIADKARTPEELKNALDAAQGFADKDKALLARVRAAREKKR